MLPQQSAVLVGSYQQPKGRDHGFIVGAVRHRRSARCFSRSSAQFVRAEEESSEERDNTLRSRTAENGRLLPGIEGSSR